MKANLRLYFAYLRNPVYLKNEKIQWSAFFKLFIAVFLLSLPLGAVVFVLSHFLHLHSLASVKYLKQNHIPLWKIAIVAPILEETLFRFLLKPCRRNIFYAAVILFVLVIVEIIIGKYYHAVLYAVIAIIPLIFLLKTGFLKQAQKYFLKHFVLFFYLSCLIFGLAHVSNFRPFSEKLLLLAPLLTLPQLFAGTILGYIRMKYDVVYSMLFHFLMNIII